MKKQREKKTVYNMWCIPTAIAYNPLSKVELGTGTQTGMFVKVRHPPFTNTPVCAPSWTSRSQEK